jgi:hypothetical protein
VWFSTGGQGGLLSRFEGVILGSGCELATALPVGQWAFPQPVRRLRDYVQRPEEQPISEKPRSPYERGPLQSSGCIGATIRTGARATGGPTRAGLGCVPEKGRIADGRRTALDGDRCRDDRREGRGLRYRRRGTAPLRAGLPDRAERRFRGAGPRRLDAPASTPPSPRSRRRVCPRHRRHRRHEPGQHPCLLRRRTAARCIPRSLGPTRARALPPRPRRGDHGRGASGLVGRAHGRRRQPHGRAHGLDGGGETGPLGGDGAGPSAEGLGDRAADGRFVSDPSARSARWGRTGPSSATSSTGSTAALRRLPELRDPASVAGEARLPGAERPGARGHGADGCLGVDVWRRREGRGRRDVSLGHQRDPRRHLKPTCTPPRARWSSRRIWA